MYEFLSGAIMLASWVAGLLFFGFWRQSRDRLLLAFAVSFWILGIERLVLGLSGMENEPRAPIYLLRLSAFILMLLAIIDANRIRRRSAAGET